jgi:hypothetical protein
LAEYKFIYKSSFFDDSLEILNKAGLSRDSTTVSELTKECIHSSYKEASRHFGQSYFNAATMAGIFRIMLKKLATSHGVEFPIKKTLEGQDASPWWHDFIPF